MSQVKRTRADVDRGACCVSSLCRSMNLTCVSCTATHHALRHLCSVRAVLLVTNIVPRAARYLRVRSKWVLTPLRDCIPLAYLFFLWLIFPWSVVFCFCLQADVAAALVAAASLKDLRGPRSPPILEQGLAGPGVRAVPTCHPPRPPPGRPCPRLRRCPPRRRGHSRHLRRVLSFPVGSERRIRPRRGPLWRPLAGAT